MTKLVTFLLVWTLSMPASAYLDPGTGSVLLQSLIGAVAIAVAGIGAFFGRIRAFFSARKPSSGASSDASASGRPPSR